MHNNFKNIILIFVALKNLYPDSSAFHLLPVPCSCTFVKKLFKLEKLKGPCHKIVYPFNPNFKYLYTKKI